MWQFKLAERLGCWVLVAALLLPSGVSAVDQSECKTYPPPQMDLNQCAADRLNEVDDELNRVYHAIISKYKEDYEFLEKLRNAQHAWSIFRDAELEARFPAESKQSQYGSVYLMCAAYFLAQRTQERIRQLQEWLDGTEEGDVCAGSVQIKQEH